MKVWIDLGGPLLTIAAIVGHPSASRIRPRSSSSPPCSRRFAAVDVPIVWVVAISLMALLVAVMKRRADHALDEVLRRERDHSASLAASLAERTRAEAARRALFERNLAGIFRSRRDARILEANAALVHLLGFKSRDELLARNATTLYTDTADRERLMKLLQPGVVVSNHEARWRRADGTPIWVLITVREVVEGPSSYLEGIVLHITDRKRAELGMRSVPA